MSFILIASRGKDRNMASYVLVSLAVLFAVTSVIFVTTHEFFIIWRGLFKLPQLIGGFGKFYSDYREFSANELPDFTPKDHQEYDFVVVGAGSAGATLAARLSEIEDATVLLIEAGGHEDLIMDIPVAAMLMQYYNYNGYWGYMSEPSDDYCRAFVNKQCRCQQGKVMGGSSTANAMLAVKGNKHDYDEWSELTGDESWSYKEMLRIFKKLEKFDVTLAEVNRSLHGFGGPVRIANPPYQSPLADAFVEAGKEMGFPQIDYNGRDQKGFAYIQTNQVNGERLSTNRAYLHPARSRKNLFVSMHSHVSRVLIEPGTKTARGVEFIKDGKTIEVRAKKEIVLSAGGVGSAKILMHSGVGPADHLRSFGIDVVQDAPVGENLMDHVSYGGLTFLVNETVGIVLKDLVEPENTAIYDFLHNRTGQMTIPCGIEALGFLDVDKPNLRSDRPNIEFMFAALSYLSDSLLRPMFNLDRGYYREYFSSNLYRHAWLIWPVLLKPKSRGRVLLRSADPEDEPRLLINYFADPDDVRVLIKGIRAAIEVSKTRAMQRYGSKLMDQPIPGCEHHEQDSDEYWECAIRTHTMTIWHYSGTCKMGKEDDPTTVVNSKLQVKGIKRLRVADVSIMPNIISGHPNIPAIAIGEKCADVIKSYHGYPTGELPD